MKTNEKQDEKQDTVSEEAVSDNQELLEKEHGGTLIRAVNLPDEYSELKQWINTMKFGGQNVLAVIKEKRVTVKWYTADSVISVSARLPNSDFDNGYLGGGASHRAPRPGETWTRGNDLADGPYCEETWNRILADAAGWSAEPLQIEV